MQKQQKEEAISLNDSFSLPELISRLESILQHLPVTEEPSAAYNKPHLRLCLCCGEAIQGRADKKFCNAYCRSQYHYQHKNRTAPPIAEFINKQLKLNRKLLAEYNKAGKTTLRTQVLLDLGFNPKVFTHYWRAKNGNVYFFIYEFGFMQIKEHGQQKYLIIQWQDYMAV